MKLTARRIPEEFIQAIPKGIRLVKREGSDFLLIDSLFCPNGHNLIVDSVRIHGEASVKLKVVINGETGFIFVDAFWGSHAKLFSFIPKNCGDHPVFVEARCPECDAVMTEDYACTRKGCGSGKSVLLLLPGHEHKIHVCAKLGCPGHVLEIKDMSQQVVRSVSVINYFGAGGDDPFRGI